MSPSGRASWEKAARCRAHEELGHEVLRSAPRDLMPTLPRHTQNLCFAHGWAVSVKTVCKAKKKNYSSRVVNP